MRRNIDIVPPQYMRLGRRGAKAFELPMRLSKLQGSLIALLGEIVEVVVLVHRMPPGIALVRTAAAKNFWRRRANLREPTAHGFVVLRDRQQAGHLGLVRQQSLHLTIETGLELAIELIVNRMLADREAPLL